MDILIEALQIIKDKFENWKLIIAGEFWIDRQSFNSKIENAQLQNSIIIIDEYIPNEDIHIYFSASDALIAPYIKGTQSGSISIALGYSLPIITTKHIAVNIPDEFQDIITSIPPNDPSALAIAITNLIKNYPQQKKHLKRSENFNWSILKSIRTLIQ